MERQINLFYSLCAENIHMSGTNNFRDINSFLSYFNTGTSNLNLYVFSRKTNGMEIYSTQHIIQISRRPKIII